MQALGCRAGYGSGNHSLHMQETMFVVALGALYWFVLSGRIAWQLQWPTSPDLSMLLAH